jgi:hypothetical protein
MSLSLEGACSFGRLVGRPIRQIIRCREDHADSIADTDIADADDSFCDILRRVSAP